MAYISEVSGPEYCTSLSWSDIFTFLQSRQKILGKFLQITNYFAITPNECFMVAFTVRN
jgi:hypothetical protein